MARPVRSFIAAVLITALAGWATPARAQTVTWAELQGVRVELVAVFDLRTRRGGEERRGRVRGSWKIVIGPGQSLTGTLTRINSAGAKTNSATFELAKPQKFADGDTVWIFENGSLVNLRTFRAGGFKITVNFSRSAGRLGCASDAVFVRENGVGVIRRDSITGPGNVQILSATRKTSTCRISPR